MPYIVPMQMVRQTILAVCALGVAVNATAEQRPLDNYNSIIERNPFGLKDPPVAKPPAETNALVKKEDFYLTGISTIGSRKKPKAYLIAKDNTKKDYDQKFFNLTVGDRQGDVTLQEVDEKGRRVKIVYLGEEKWLSMKDNGVPAPVGPAPGMQVVPGVPGQHPAGMQPPGAVPIPLPNANPPTPQHAPQPLSYPNSSNPNRRNPRTSYGGAMNNSGYVNPAGVPQPTYGAAQQGYGAPNLNFNQSGNPASQPASSPESINPAELPAKVVDMYANEALRAKMGEIRPPLPSL
jgi:hypothetical protein